MPVLLTHSARTYFNSAVLLLTLLTLWNLGVELEQPNVPAHSFFDKSWNLMLPPPLPHFLPLSFSPFFLSWSWDGHTLAHCALRERGGGGVKAEVGARDSLRTPLAVLPVKLACFSYALNFEHRCRQTDPAKASDRGAVVSSSEALTDMDETLLRAAPPAVSGQPDALVSLPGVLEALATKVHRNLRRTGRMDELA